MNATTVLLTILAVVAAVAGLYALHRLCLWLDKRGWVYYRRKGSGSSAVSCFVALQQHLEPPIRHVHEMKEHRDKGEARAPSADGSGVEDA